MKICFRNYSNVYHAYNSDGKFTWNGLLLEDLQALEQRLSIFLPDNIYIATSRNYYDSYDFLIAFHDEDDENLFLVMIAGGLDI